MKDKLKTLLVLNPVAGKGKGKKSYPFVLARLKENFEHVDARTSEYAGHIYEIGREAAAAGYQRIITIGGDGTLFELINGLYTDGEPKQEIKLGMIPAGTGNSFLRDFGDVDPKSCLEAVLKGTTREVDLVEFQYQKEGKTTTQHFINIVGVGLIADVLKLTNEKLKWMGRFSYGMAVLIRLFRGMNNTYNIIVDGTKHQFKNSALVISNSKFTGGGMRIAPMADPFDGKVDLVIFNQVNRREILSIFLNVFKGTHVNHPKVTLLKGSHIEVRPEPPLLLMGDGELLDHTPLTMKVLPGELSILI